MANNNKFNIKFFGREFEKLTNCNDELFFTFDDVYNENRKIEGMEELKEEFKTVKEKFRNGKKINYYKLKKYLDNYRSDNLDDSFNYYDYKSVLNDLSDFNFYKKQKEEILKKYYVYNINLHDHSLQTFYTSGSGFVDFYGGWDTTSGIGQIYIDKKAVKSEKKANECAVDFCEDLTSMRNGFCVCGECDPESDYVSCGFDSVEELVDFYNN